MKQSYAHATMLLTARFALLLLVMVIVMEADARPVPPSPSTLSSLSRWGVVGGPADSAPSIPILAAAETSMDDGGRWGQHQARDGHDGYETCTQEGCGGGSGALRGKREELAFSYPKSGGGTEEAWNLAEEEAWGRERYYGARGIENRDLEAGKSALYHGEYVVEKCAYGDSQCFLKHEH